MSEMTTQEMIEWLENSAIGAEASQKANIIAARLKKHEALLRLSLEWAEDLKFRQAREYSGYEWKSEIAAIDKYLIDVRALLDAAREVEK